MNKYKVVFEFYCEEDHCWKPDFFSKNGEGFTYEEAEYLANFLATQEFITAINIIIKSMEA